MSEAVMTQIVQLVAQGGQTGAMLFIVHTIAMLVKSIAIPGILIAGIYKITTVIVNAVNSYNRAMQVCKSIGAEVGVFCTPDCSSEFSKIERWVNKMKDADAA